MPKISPREFEALPLRVHTFLSGVPLHDVWAVDLPRVRSGITLDEFLRTTDGCMCTPPLVVRTLLRLRRAFGWLMGWDHEPPTNAWRSFATRLTTADHSRSLAAPGCRDGIFRTVYRFENEQLQEVINRTAHAGALSALVENGQAYRFYFAVYVNNVSRFTQLYMTLVDPLRTLIVYPSLLRDIRAKWSRSFGEA
jgi:hypothetical protein